MTNDKNHHYIYGSKPQSDTLVSSNADVERFYTKALCTGKDK